MAADSAHTLFWWAAVTALALIAAIATQGHRFHQLSIGIVLTAATLFILLSLVEIVWLVVEVSTGLRRSSAR